MSVVIQIPADAIFRCVGRSGMSRAAAEDEADLSRGTLSIIDRRLSEGNCGLKIYMKTFIRLAHACGYRIIIATEPGAMDSDVFDLGEETLQ